MPEKSTSHVVHFLQEANRKIKVFLQNQQLNRGGGGLGLDPAQEEGNHQDNKNRIAAPHCWLQHMSTRTRTEGISKRTEHTRQPKCIRPQEDLHCWPECGKELLIKTQKWSATTKKVIINWDDKIVVWKMKVIIAWNMTGLQKKLYITIILSVMNTALTKNILQPKWKKKLCMWEGHGSLPKTITLGGKADYLEVIPNERTESWEQFLLGTGKENEEELLLFIKSPVKLMV